MKFFPSDKENLILSLITNDSLLAEKVGMLCNVDLYPNLEQPESLSNDQLRYSISGKVFAHDGGGGDYALLEDGSIGYNGQEYECGRIAENFMELLEIGLNCAYSWFNYSQKGLMNNPDLLQQETMKCELIGNKQFVDAYGNEIGELNELKKELASLLNLHISDDISKDILPRFFTTATREPLYFWEHKESLARSDDLVR